MMSLLFFIFFHFEVYMIENGCSEKGETFLISTIIYLFFGADWPSILWPDGNVGSAYTNCSRVKWQVCVLLLHPRGEGMTADW